MRKIPILLLCLLLATLLFSCKVKPREIPPMPEKGAIEATLNTAVDPMELPALKEGELDQKITWARTNLQMCEEGIQAKRDTCNEREAAKLHLMLGDLRMIEKNNETAIKHYEQAILANYMAFEADNKQRSSLLDLNQKEIGKLGEQNNLKAGRAYIECKYAVEAHRDFAEMARAERRLMQAQKAAGNEDAVADALLRSNKAIEKAVENRMNYERNKREILRVIDNLGPDFQQFLTQIDTWDVEMDIRRF